MFATILVVEDNEGNRLLIGDILKYYGYEVIEAVNGQEGIFKVKQYKPDLIILDIQMPVMNGFEVLKILRNDSDYKTIKIIAVTSFAMFGEKEKILEAGADDYISKPLNTRELPKKVKSLLERSISQAA